CRMLGIQLGQYFIATIWISACEFEFQISEFLREPDHLLPFVIDIPSFRLKTETPGFLLLLPFGRGLSSSSRRIILWIFSARVISVAAIAPGKDSRGIRHLPSINAGASAPRAVS